MKEFKHFGVYGLIIEDNKVVLVKKNGGPYDGKFDLPGGSFEFSETPQEALKRELLEEKRKSPFFKNRAFQAVDKVNGLFFF